MAFAEWKNRVTVDGETTSFERVEVESYKDFHRRVVVEVNVWERGATFEMSERHLIASMALTPAMALELAAKLIEQCQVAGYGPFSVEAVSE